MLHLRKKIMRSSSVRSAPGWVVRQRALGDLEAAFASASHSARLRPRRCLKTFHAARAGALAIKLRAWIGGARACAHITNRARRRGRRCSGLIGSDPWDACRSICFICGKRSAEEVLVLWARCAPPAPWVRANQATKASSSSSGVASSDAASAVRIACASAASVRAKQRRNGAGEARPAGQNTPAISRRNSVSSRSIWVKAGGANMASGGLKGEGPLGARLQPRRICFCAGLATFGLCLGGPGIGRSAIPHRRSSPPVSRPKSPLCPHPRRLTAKSHTPRLCGNRGSV